MDNLQNDDTLPPKLNGIKEGTFVHYTIRERWPKTLAKSVNNVHCERHSLMDEYGPEADADVKSIIHELSELRYRIMTDKPLENLTDTSYNFEMWNQAIEDLRNKHGVEEATWFRMDWLFTECLMYRIVIGAVAKTKHLKNFDIFREQKIEGFDRHLDHIRDNINYMLSVVGKIDEKQEKETLEVLLKKQSPTEATRTLDSFILCNDFKAAIDSFLLKLEANKKGLRELHIVLDNTGPELVSDLVLADYLMESKLVDKIVLHGKEYPYFVSDVTARDFEWTLVKLKKLGGICQQLYQRLSEKVTKSELVFHDHRFWTYPHPYCEMKTVAPDLYAELSEASIIIFKGDLNYRKLVADRDWPYETPFKKALNGFLPAPILALRSLKAETVAGLPADVAERMRCKPDLGWMVTGEYGVAQLTF